MLAPPEIDGLLLAESAELKRTIVELREEIARLKGLKGRPQRDADAPSKSICGTIWTLATFNEAMSLATFEDPELRGLAGTRP